jgi:hypothetical protein
VKKLKNGEMDISIHIPLVEDMKAVLRDVQDHDVGHVQREANDATHRFPKDGCYNKLCKTWVGVRCTPVYAMNLVASVDADD